MQILHICLVFDGCDIDTPVVAVETQHLTFQMGSFTVFCL